MLARAHIAALGLPKKVAFEKKSWVGHLPMFLRSFHDVPAREELAKEWDKVMKSHRKAAVGELRKYYAALRKDKFADAFKAGVAAVKKGFLYFECVDAKFRNKLAQLRKQAKQLKLPKKAVKDYDALLPDFGKAIKEGSRAFDGVNKKAPKL